VVRYIAKSLLLILVFVAAAGISTYLTINLLIQSEEPVVVPQLTGKEVVHVLELLTDLGLDTKVKGSEYNEDMPRNFVVSQDPAPGSEIKKGRDVRIVISKGARTVVLPNLADMGASRARILLEKNDLQQGRLAYVYDSTHPKEDVLAQYPQSGSIGLRGDRVDLLVSAGPAPRIMPMVDISGMVLHQAIAAIESHHLTTGAIQTIQNVNIANDTVIDQNPAGGYPVAMGQPIDMTVNRHQYGAIASSRRDDAALFRHRTAEGFLKQHLRVNINRASGGTEIFNDFVKPGKEIWLVVPKTEPSTLLLYVDEELVKTIYYH